MMASEESPTSNQKPVTSNQAPKFKLLLVFHSFYLHDLRYPLAGTGFLLKVNDLLNI